MELLRYGTWLPVCQSGTWGSNPTDLDYFDDVAASVVCSQLGYTTLPTSVEAPNAFGPSALGGEFLLGSYCGSAIGTARLDQCTSGSDPSTACISFAAVTCANSSGTIGVHVGQCYPACWSRTPVPRCSAMRASKTAQVGQCIPPCRSIQSIY